MLQFGADGYLYASVGDGDPGVLNRAGAFAQRLDDLLGNLVRIDPRGGRSVSRFRRTTPSSTSRTLDRRSGHTASGTPGASGSIPRRTCSTCPTSGARRARRSTSSRAAAAARTSAGPASRERSSSTTTCNVRAAGRAARRLPTCERSVRGHRRRRRRATRAPALVGSLPLRRPLRGPMTALARRERRRLGVRRARPGRARADELRRRRASRIYVMSLRGGVYRLDPKRRASAERAEAARRPRPQPGARARSASAAT